MIDNRFQMFDCCLTLSLIGIFVGRADDPEIGGRGTSAAFVLDSIEEVERFLDTLAR